MSESIDESEFTSKVLDSLKTKVSDFNFNNWFKSAQWSIPQKGHVRVSVPSKFIRDWILEHYLEVIKFEFFKASGHEHEITFHVQEKRGVTPDKSSAPHAPSTTSTPSVLTAGLTSRYNFDNFVVGNSNQFANAACHAVAANPAKNYNPLFIYGGVGLGKTHLLNAIGLETLQKNRGFKIVFATGEQFTNEVINSIRYDKTYDLRKKYRTQCDLLLIDDVQFIAGKERTMEEFFHTFNTLYEARKQIVLTSDTLPKDIPNLTERVRSRFSWGLLADIQPPDFETRCAILRKKGEADKIKIPDDVVQYIASHIKTNVRDLEGCLVRVSAFASLAPAPITVDLATEVLKNVHNVFAPTITITSIQETVATHFKLRICDLKSPRRYKNLAFPRQIAMYLCKKHLKASFPEIGRQFGGKDHTTVIHAVKRINHSLISNPTLKDQLEQIEKSITQ